MRALVIHRPGHAIVQDVQRPQLRAGWVLIRPRLVGICGSDLHAYAGPQPFVSYPFIPGHEMVGEIVEVGQEADEPVAPGRWMPANLVEGMRVVIDPAVPCGVCVACRAGRYNACAGQQVIGVHLPGAAAEYVAVRGDCCVPVPDWVDDEAGAVVEPLSVGLQACRRGRVTEEDRVCIVGAGAIGLSVLLQARALGARCAVVEPDEWRQKVAAELGAEVVATPQEAERAVGAWEDGPTVAVEAAGRPDTLALAMELVAPAGRVVVLGFWPGEIAIDGTCAVRKELDIMGSRLHLGTVQETVALVAAGLVDPRPLVSAVEELEAGPRVMEELTGGRLRAVKVLLRP